MTNQQQQKLLKQRLQCREKFLKKFPEGFNDPQYLEQVREKKWKAHEMFQLLLNRKEFERLLVEEDYQSIAKNAIIVEADARLLLPSEKTALKDLSKSVATAKTFATGLFNSLYSNLNVKERFEKFRETLSSFPKKQKQLVTWPMQTAFTFLGNPEHHIFLKPAVTRAAAKSYGFDFFFEPRPNWNTYQSVFSFANQVKEDISDLNPKDFIDLQYFMQVIGSGKASNSKK